MLLFIMTAVGSIACYFASGAFVTLAVNSVSYPPSRRLFMTLGCLLCVAGFCLLLASYSIYPRR